MAALAIDRQPGETCASAACWMGAAAATPSVPPPCLPRHDAFALTGGGTRALIALNGRDYTLTVTRSGKLILTK